jgi:hypothetical protein
MEASHVFRMRLSDCSGMSWDVELDDNVDTKWTGILNDFLNVLFAVLH